MLPLGTRAPAFSLRDAVSGKTVSRDDFPGKRGLLVVFMCNHCPYVKHVRDEIARLGRDLQAKDVGMVGISANDADKYPDDAPDKMAAEAEAAGYVFPYLFDATQEVAKAYRAACTPDFFLFDQNLELYYRGQLDDSRPRNDAPVDGRDLRAAVDSLLQGEPPPQEQKPSLGCNIKWKPGNEPEYFG